MKRVWMIAVLALVACAPALFAIEIGLGVDADVGYPAYILSASASSGGGVVLYGAAAVAEAWFTPQISCELKAGYCGDVIESSGTVTLNYIAFAGMAKYYIIPQLFIGAGFEYDYLFSETGNGATYSRSELGATGEAFDVGFVTAVVGTSFSLTPKLVLPVKLNFGYAVINSKAFSSTVTARMRVGAEVGLRYML